jgi:hypothetical protein
MPGFEEIELRYRAAHERDYRYLADMNREAGEDTNRYDCRGI